MGRGPGPVVSGSHRKIFELRGEPSQILRGKGGSCRYMYWFERALKRKWGGGGVMQNFSEIIKIPPPLPPIKNERSLSKEVEHIL